MTAESLLQSGNIAAAMEELQNAVRNNPADSKLRVFLFQLFAICGEWKRAQTQLNMAGELDSNATHMVQAYTDVINCELHRQAVFEGKSQPLIFGQPEDWVAQLVQAQQAFARGDMEAYASFNAAALEKAEPSSGMIDEVPFEWLSDADQRFGPVFEAIFNGQYYWVPMANVRSLRMEQPTDLRDLVWQPAEMTLTNGGRQMVMMPSRYPRLEGASDGDLLARRTNWEQVGEDLLEGVGQRLLATDRDDYPFLQVRDIVFDE